jgi:hypothetical protein
VIRLVALFVVAFSACAPVVQITGAVRFGDKCEPNASSPEVLTPLLDIGIDASSAHEYVAAFTVHSYDDGVVTFDGIDAFVSIDGASFTGAKTPTTEDAAKHTSIGATSREAVVFAPAVTSSVALALQSENAVSQPIAAGVEPTIVAHVRLDGADESGARVQSQWFPLPIALCAGCLTTPPDCGHAADGTQIEPVANAAMCIAGDDEPSLICPP